MHVSHAFCMTLIEIIVLHFITLCPYALHVKRLARHVTRPHLFNGSWMRDARCSGFNEVMQAAIGLEFSALSGAVPHFSGFHASAAVRWDIAELFLLESFPGF